MGVFQDIGNAIGEAAKQGEEVVKHVLNQVGGVIGYQAGNQLLGGGANLFGFGNTASGQPQSAPPIPQMSGAGPGRLVGLLSAALTAGKTIAGTQPYAVTSLHTLASASAITKNSDIADMFSTIYCPAFTSNDTFPWPFQSYRMRWTYSGSLGITAAGGANQVTDPAWIATLHAVFSNATEIARVALNNLGLRTSLTTTYQATTAVAAGLEIETQPGVLWPVYYEKVGSYVMSYRTDHAVGTTQAGLQVSVQLDGWVINDPTLVNADASQIQATLDAIMSGSVGESQLVSMLGKRPA